MAAMRAGQSASPLPWWRAVLKNAFLSSLRSETRRRRREEIAAEAGDVLTEGAHEDDHPETLACLRAALTHLPEQQATIVRRLYFEGLSVEETARVQGQSPRTVGRLRDLAFGNLRRAITSNDPPRARGKSGMRMLWPTLPWLQRSQPKARTTTELGSQIKALVASLLRLAATALPCGVIALVLLGVEKTGDTRSLSPSPSAHRAPFSLRGERRLPAFASAVNIDKASGASAEAAGATEAPLPPAAASPAGATQACGSLQQLIDQAHPGDVLHVPPCVYRESVNVTKALTLLAASGAEIRGSDVWDDFVAWLPGPDGDRRWLSERSLPVEVMATNFTARCQPESVTACPGTEQVFIDGKPLQRVGAASAVGPGRFTLDSDQRLILGDDPSQGVVEVSMRARWMSIHANDVTVSGFSMQHASNLSVQQGALFVRLGSHNVKLIRNRFAHASGVALTTEGTGHQITENEIAWAGREGVEITHTTLAGHVLVEGNRVHHNGASVALTRQRWVSGGISLIFSAAKLSQNIIHDNFGIGLFVAASQAPVIQDNTIENNRGAGIASSSSHRALIERNVLRGNGWGASPVEPAMMFVRTRGFEVRDNQVEALASGIFVGPAMAPALPAPGSCASSGLNTFYNNRIHAGEAQGAVRMGGETPQVACPNNIAIGNQVLAAAPQRL